MATFSRVGADAEQLQAFSDRTRANRLLDRFLGEELEAGPSAFRTAP
jgi:hypothetical protein